jgi:hypothetical protein
MTRNSSDLDLAIDVVAKRLTQVDDDPVLASAIIAALPERTTWFGWLATSWAPRLAVLAIAAGSSLLFVNRQPAPVTPALLPATTGMMIAALPTAPEPLELHLRTKPLEPLEPLKPLEPLELADHEFSLPAISVTALAPIDLPAEAFIELAPLAIADLPLSGEFPERH